MKKIKIISFVLLILLCIEIILKKIKPSPYKYDYEIGWVTKNNFKFNYKQRDFYDQKYLSQYSTNNFGAREYLKKNKRHLKKNISILVAGDSFTIDPYVGNQDMWFAHMANHLSNKLNHEIKVYALGGGAYGTLQQFLVLSRNINQIKKINPKIFILQFCDNDFYNNSYILEKKNMSVSQYMRRPYFYENKIFFHNSIFAHFFRENIITRDSRVFAKAIFLYEIILRKFFSENKTANLKDINETHKITSDLLKKISNLLHNSEKYIFSCSDNNSDINQRWKSLAQENGFNVLVNSSNYIAKSLNEKKKIFYKDGGHLNLLGNKELGNLIYEEIMKIK